MKTFELTMTLRNNLIKRRRIELNLSSKEAAKGAGIGYALWLDYEGLRQNPLSTSQDILWKPSAMAIAKFLGCSCEELFPNAVLSVKTPTISKEIDGERVAALISYHANLEPPMLPDAAIEALEISTTVRDATRKLSRRERAVMRHRFQEDRSYADTGDFLGVSAERIRQIEKKALRKIEKVIGGVP